MEILFYILIFIFGAIIGSFLNVVIYRLHTGRSLGGRSHCLSCGKFLVWYELFPIFSYAALRAKCRGCGAYIPSRYFLVEFLTAFTFAWLWFLTAGNVFLFMLYISLASLLIIIAIYDLRHTIIPDELSLLVGIVALIYLGHNVLITGEYVRIAGHILSGLAAGTFFAGLWYASKGKWMGLGDAKLAFPLGVIVGYPGVYTMIVLSFWIGALISLGILALQYVLKRGKPALVFMQSPITIRSEVPFAPFLILGFICVQLLNANIFDITFSILAF